MLGLRNALKLDVRNRIVVPVFGDGVGKSLEQEEKDSVSKNHRFGLQFIRIEELTPEGL